MKYALRCVLLLGIVVLVGCKPAPATTSTKAMIKSTEVKKADTAPATPPKETKPDGGVKNPI